MNAVEGEPLTKRRGRGGEVRPRGGDLAKRSEAVEGCVHAEERESRGTRFRADEGVDGRYVRQQRGLLTRVEDEDVPKQWEARNRALLAGDCRWMLVRFDRGDYLEVDERG